MDNLHEFFEAQCDKTPSKTCLICDATHLTYREIDEQANQLSHWLLENGIGPEQKVGVLIERSSDLYVSLLAILKAGAAFVPIDCNFPLERIKYIVEDADLSLLLTLQDTWENYNLSVKKIIALPKIKPILAKYPINRVCLNDVSSDNLSYVIYTSGTTGWPKGVAITHRSVCNFVKSAIQIYGVNSSDRVYQGFTISFDASLEEIWLAFASGGTLVTSGMRSVYEGAHLVDFLNLHRVTVFSTVPTMLAMIDPCIPTLKVLISGGEVCSQELITRWARPELKIFNTYGPSEATIVSTYLECHPDRRITIGKPIPNCEILILNSELQPVEPGISGELCIGGLGLARGYLNKPDLTSQKFIPHPLHPDKRLYRSGDLARISHEGEIEYLGRLDHQIKLRGFRIELEEIENAIRHFPGIRDAAVTVNELIPGMQSLTAYLVVTDEVCVSAEKIRTALKHRLPSYMVPSLFEILPSLPKTTCGKIDRNSLPKPSSFKNLLDKNYQHPKTSIQKKITSVWENVLKISPISIDADFFSDLGGHSLAAATIVSELRKHKKMDSISLSDMYENSTVRALSEKITFLQKQKIKKDKSTTYTKTDTFLDKLRYWFCAAIQALFSLVLITISPWHFFLIMLIVTTFAMSIGTIFSWYFLMLCVAFLFLLEPGLIVFSVIVKWTLLGKIKPGKYKLWGFYYLRWWITQHVQDLVAMDLLVGSVFINLYCRMMGAKIGKNCYIGTDQLRSFDLLSMGNNASLGADVIASGYIVEGDYLKIGSITIGENCSVGADCVLSINTKLEDGSKLNEHSLLPEGSTVPRNQVFQGSPAEPVTKRQPITNNKTFKNNSFKRLFYVISQYSLFMILQFIPAIAAVPGIFLIVNFCYSFGELIHYFWAIPLSAGLFVFIFFLEIFIFKKIFGKVKKGTFAIKSFSYLKIWFIDRLTALSLRTMESLYGTMYSATWFKLLGANIGKNTELATVGFSYPDMLQIGEESFIADSTMLAPVRIENGYISLDYVDLGKRVFIGNGSLVPADTKINDNCLIACSSVPPSRIVASNTSWLGSPSFFLPRREIKLACSENKTYKPTIKARLGRGTIEIFRILLPSIFFYFILTADVITFIFLNHKYNLLTALLLFPFFSFAYVLAISLFIVSLKWLLIGKYQENAAPMWTPYVWLSEFITGLYDTFVAPLLLEALLGTPFVAAFLRLFGAKIGKRVFINTLYFSEFDLINIGDHVALNRESTIQTHLFEDRIFKMAHVKIENRCSIGDRSIILYNTMMKHDASLGNLSLLMKGEILYPHSHWQGVPAKRI